MGTPSSALALVKYHVSLLVADSVHILQVVIFPPSADLHPGDSRVVILNPVRRVSAFLIFHVGYVVAADEARAYVADDSVAIICERASEVPVFPANGGRGVIVINGPITRPKPVRGQVQVPDRERNTVADLRNSGGLKVPLESLKSNGKPIREASKAKFTFPAHYATRLALEAFRYLESGVVCKHRLQILVLVWDAKGRDVGYLER